MQASLRLISQQRWTVRLPGFQGSTGEWKCERRLKGPENGL